MNLDSTTSPELAKNGDSDHSSASPAASGYSDLHDDEISSVETTPPPSSEEQTVAHNSTGLGRPKRYSSNSSTYSRSYQSAPSGTAFAGSAPSGSSISGQYRQQSSEHWPSTPGVSNGMDDDEEANLVAAVKSLCSFGTPRSGPVHLPPDVPPVPPLPAKFLSQNLHGLSEDPLTPTFHHSFGVPPLTHQLSQERNVSRGRKDEHVSEEDAFYQRTVIRGRSDEDDDGVFGRMEE